MARVTIYLPDELHRRWRDELDYVNLSKLATRALTEVLDIEAGTETVYLCDMCQRRAGRALRNTGASDRPGMHGDYVTATPAPHQNGRSAAV